MMPSKRHTLHRRLRHEPLRHERALYLLVSVRRPLCGGFINDKTGDGEVWRCNGGKFTRDSFTRQIRNGQWHGGWVRERAKSVPGKK